ncbi:hypothetical protein J6590_017991 [Homalodisca vitripennis]|nr:hypothetical protein J6590_017991 [Homalodisca vitripennis]
MHELLLMAHLWPAMIAVWPGPGLARRWPHRLIDVSTDQLINEPLCGRCATPSRHLANGPFVHNYCYAFS